MKMGRRQLTPDLREFLLELARLLEEHKMKIRVDRNDAGKLVFCGYESSVKIRAITSIGAKGIIDHVTKTDRSYEYRLLQRAKEKTGEGK